MSEVFLILGGTKEAAALAAKLVTEKPDARIISSLAGRTKEPKPMAGEVRIGGFGGVAGLVQFIADHHVTKLIDATHPFAFNISNNAQHAAQMSGVDFEIIQRKPWQKQVGDQWIEVANIAQAIQAIPQNSRVLLALGSQYIAPFAQRSDTHFIIRMVDKPLKPLGFEQHTLIVGKPGDVAHEKALLRTHKITHIICRNSGGKGAYAKIEAARDLRCPIIIINHIAQPYFT